jgi:hypothetical protein
MMMTVYDDSEGEGEGNTLSPLLSTMVMRS